MHSFAVNYETFSYENKLQLQVAVLATSNKCLHNIFRSNVSSKFLHFVGKVLDEKAGKVSTRVNLSAEKGGIHLCTVRKKSRNWFYIPTDENTETLEISAINYVPSMLAMFLTVLYVLEYVRS